MYRPLWIDPAEDGNGRVTRAIRRCIGNELGKLYRDVTKPAENKVSRSNVNRIVAGRIKVQIKILDALGLERVEFYAKR
jgi:hypothetical protein